MLRDVSSTSSRFFKSPGGSCASSLSVFAPVIRAGYLAFSPRQPRLLKFLIIDLLFQAISGIPEPTKRRQPGSMLMIPFYNRFPELAARETRCIVIGPGKGLPDGEYGFIEHYCEEPDCDCRRVLLQVTSPQPPHSVLATINFGWESLEFYTGRMHGDEQAAREITEASLDPLHPQSQHADHLLTIFQQEIITDPEYVRRLARHYELFKQDQLPPGASSPGLFKSQPATVPRFQTVPDILRQLQHVPEEADFAPYEAALCAAAEHQAAITPELIAAIDRVSDNPARYLDDPSGCLHNFALYLLAEFHETRALDSFMRFFCLPGDQALNLTGDMITEKGAAVLASVCGGDPAPLLRLIHDEAVNEFIRTAALEALAVQSLWGERPREAVVEELRRLFTTLPKPGNSYVWASLTGLLCDFHVPELASEARQAFEEGLVDEGVLTWEWLEKELREREMEDLRDFEERFAPIDAVNESSMWLCFREENDRTPIPYIAPPKTGRNESCPCGSGRKYKKCCGK
jgi:uncharacterized protein YchJ